MSIGTIAPLLLGLFGAQSDTNGNIRPIGLSVLASIGPSITYADFRDEGEPSEIRDLNDDSRVGLQILVEAGLIAHPSGFGVGLCYENLTTSPGSAAPYTRTKTWPDGSQGPEYIGAYQPTIDLQFAALEATSYQQIGNGPLFWSAVLGIGRIWRRVDTDIQVVLVPYSGYSVKSTETIHQEGNGLLLGAGIDYRFASRFAFGLTGRLVTGDVEETYHALDSKQVRLAEDKKRIDHIGLGAGLRVVF